MNLLPLVLSILIILALGTSTIHHTLTSISLEKKGICGYFQTLRKYRAHMENGAYTEATRGIKKTLPPDDKKKDPPQPKPKTSRTRERDYVCKSEVSKFNLSNLLNKPDTAKSQFIYDAAARLIEALYKNAPFYREGLNYEILKALIKEKNHAFLKLFPEDPNLSEIFYKMLQGTSSFDVQNGKGYPPFFGYFTLQEWTAEPKPVNFCDASIPVLISVFGENLTLAIVEEEKKKAFKETDLEAFALQHTSKAIDAAFSEALLSFTRVKGKGSVTAFTDENSRITLRKQNDASVDDEEEES